MARDFDLTETNGAQLGEAGRDRRRRAARTEHRRARAELARLRHENRQLRLDNETLKRATSFLRQGDPMTVDPFIEAEEAAGHSAKRACRLLEVSRSAYYERKKAVPRRATSPTPS